MTACDRKIIANVYNLRFYEFNCILEIQGHILQGYRFPFFKKTYILLKIEKKVFTKL